MTLSTERPISILPMAKYPPQGVPIGSHAFVLKMTPEALEQLSQQLAAQQGATASGSSSTKLSSNKTAPEKSKRNEKSLMQLVVNDDGPPQFVIGGHTFRADAINEQSTCEIYARHQSPFSDSDQPPSGSEAVGPLQMVAKVEGRLNIKREYDTISQQAVSGRTAKVNKEAKPRSAIILDATGASSSNTSVKDAMQSSHHRHKPVSHSASLSSSDVTGQLTDPKGQAALTPPKSDGSPSSASSGRRGPKHQIPEAFSTLNLTIPLRWDGFIPIPIRLIHLAALKGQTTQDVLSAASLASDSEVKEAKHALHILCEKQEGGTLRLRDESFYYLRPWCWVNYSPTNRSDASKFMRIALRRLGYDDQDEVWEHLRVRHGWSDPWKNTPEGMQHYREKEQKKTAIHSTPATKEDHEKLKAEALANPAPMLTSTIKPGFFSPAPASVKGKKVSKDKEPKAKKEKSASKSSADKESGSQPKLSHGSSQSSSTGGVDRVSTEPSVLETELSVRQSGPGSLGGKLAVARRLHKEKEEGRSSTLSTPARSPLPASPSPLANKTGTDSKKRKSEDDIYSASSKKRKSETPILATKQAETMSRTDVVKKRKASDMETAVLTSKVRKVEPSAKVAVNGHVHQASTSSVNGHERVPTPTIALNKEKATLNRKAVKKVDARPDWDYSSDEEPLSTLNQKHPKASVARPSTKAKTQHATNSLQLDSLFPFNSSRIIPPATTSRGYKALFMQKWSEYFMIRAIITGEESKWEKMMIGDDSSSLMGIDELKALVKKRDELELELKSLKAEVARLSANKS
ncbi:hypothetical protein CPB86DRAFT_703425 [Serendipita vermifera]|nr:hypothetical protein CPB86DRAFT_703425 [Serendipita vermifera]